MSNVQSAPVTSPGINVIEEVQTNVKNAPRWNVIILDDPDHTFAYVTELIVTIFRRSIGDAKALTEEIHRMGRAIIVTCSKERAELYVEQVKTWGDDPFMKVFKGKDSGPLGVTMEPADD